MYAVNSDRQSPFPAAGPIPPITVKPETADADVTPAIRSMGLHSSADWHAAPTTAKAEQLEGRGFRSRLQRSAHCGPVSIRVATADAEFAGGGASGIRSAGEWAAATNGPSDLTLRADYSPKALADPKADDWSLYSFLEGTAQRTEDPSRIDRMGIGGQRRFSRWSRLSGEVSTANGSLNAQADGSCQISNRIQFYSKSGLDSHPGDGAFAGLGGTLTSGARVRASKKASLFGEERIQLADGLRGLTHAFGFDLTPAPGWMWETRLETGEPCAVPAGHHPHYSARISAGYARKNIRYGGRMGWHLQGGAGSDRRIGWEARSDIALQTENGWNLRSHLNASLGPAGGDFRSETVGVECLAELAHRPSGRESFSMLIKYTFPPDGGVGTGGLEGSLSTSIHPTMKMGLGYAVPRFWKAGAAPFPDSQGWFVKLTGTF